MTIDYKINDNDYLTYQLYIASKSKAIKKRRTVNKVIVPLMYVALGFLFFMQAEFLMAVFFFAVGLLWFILFPLWERRHYLNQFIRCIKETYKDRLGRKVALELNNDFILAKDSGSESKVLTIELEEIAEIPTTIFVKLKGGQSFIIPKDQISDISSLTTRLKELSNHLHIRYITDDKWEWR